MITTINFYLKIFLFSLLTLQFFHTASAQIINVGNGSYTTQFPGVDEAGRNSYPSGTPFTTGAAAGKPVPTNDWWSAQLKNPHADNLFNYPFTLKSTNKGLVTTYIPWGVIDDIEPVIIGVTGLNAQAARISDFSDWTVTMNWNNAGHGFTTTTGIGMPFLYFQKNDDDIAEVRVNSGTVVVSGEMMVISNVRNGADFAVYAPAGSEWIKNGNLYTSSLNGKNYWSMAFIPLDASSVQSVANEYKKYAYVFPANTSVNWSYDQNKSIVRTDFTIETQTMEGVESTVLQGLLPHQWANLANGSPVPEQYSYQTIRGELKTLNGNSFSVENKFYGILPTLPYLDFYSDGFSPQKMQEKVNLLQNEGLSTWTDSYNEGQVMNRLIQTARIADLSGNTSARNTILQTIKARLEDWLKANSTEVAFLFYYNDTWSSMIGYPAGHGQDNNLNDHHFHWGYFIHAAAFVEQFDPGWADQWGGMINLLIRDAAGENRNDEMFPFLRNFSPYAGHCWANGFATFPQGNDQESTSESMQFNSALIHWGSITGNDAIRDLGIYLYTTEQTAIEEYWFDVYNRNFASSQPYSLVSRIWGNSYDNGTFWTNDIAASYGIELYPIHGGSLYLGHNEGYAEKLWSEIEENTGILSNEVNDNLWHDVMWEYLAFTDPGKAIELYDSYPERSLKFGVSDAQTYHWLHAMNVLGKVDTNITADSPLAATFNLDGELTYVSHNYSNAPISVNFSDGYVLEVPARKMKTSKDVTLAGILSSSFMEAYPGGSVELRVSVNGGTPGKIEFVDGEEIIGEITQAPYVFDAKNLSVGQHGMYARIYNGGNFVVSNLITIRVGEQLPFFGEAIELPGTFDAGDFDLYEGGPGQGITYNDSSPDNKGGFRPNEFVDCVFDVSEGATVGWISAGEWIEYTVEVQQAGYYSMAFRYACGNAAGGGPYQIEMDGNVVKSGIKVSNSGGWNSWKTKNIMDIPLKEGRQVLRLYFENGELNLGEFNFEYKMPLDFDQPVADAGNNILVLLPETSVTLDGSNSLDPEGEDLTYQWTQVYGPDALVFSDQQSMMPQINGLVEGIYSVKLEVDNGIYSDTDELYIIASTTGNVAPKVSILSPVDGAEFNEDKLIQVYALASDLNGYIEKVEFFVNGEMIGMATQTPYEISWTPQVGTHIITAVATDNAGSSTESETIQITINESPSCSGTSYNGDFSYEFSPDKNNPSLTFIPEKPGMGNPTCILYYGTNPNSLPGQYVTPNVPFKLTASEGSIIYFYYTYSCPGQVECNNSSNKNSYEIGSCKPTATENTILDSGIEYYPNPVVNSLFLKLPKGESRILIYDISGKLIDQMEVTGPAFNFDMKTFESGLYFFKVFNQNQLGVLKVIKL